jgi:hypothetical protein
MVSTRAAAWSEMGFVLAFIFLPIGVGWALLAAGFWVVSGFLQ